MKFTILLLALAAVIAVVNPTPVDVEARAARANLIVGNILAGDRLLTRVYVQKHRINNAIQTEDVVYRGNSNVRITTIRALEVGSTQRARAQIIQGGVGWTYATIRFTSQRGQGYYYQLEIWGR